MYDPSVPTFCQTLRAVRGPGGYELRPEGANLRYASIVALGLAQIPEDAQAVILAGSTAATLAQTNASQAVSSTDPGAVALAAWASAEILHDVPVDLLTHLAEVLRSGAAIPTVDLSWILTAALACGPGHQAQSIIDQTRRRLIDGQGADGLFPHVLPASDFTRWRAHVGSFADQVYPLQALARLHAARSDQDALERADRTAERICDLQGTAGQWWWHYDSRAGSVVERFPVYSVHQHAMAPMVLLELLEAGGQDHLDSVRRGLDWLDRHPEVPASLVTEQKGVIWRKVGRREPPKAVRAVSAATTAIRPGFHLPGLDSVFPPSKVDYECRPYELGWLLYAWLADHVMTNLINSAGS